MLLSKKSYILNTGSKYTYNSLKSVIFFVLIKYCNVNYAFTSDEANIDVGVLSTT